jgi:hypothetical protein
MPSNPGPAELTEGLKRYFWDYDPARLSWDHSRHTIVARLIEAGGFDAVRWLLDHLSDEELRDYLIRRGGRGIAPERLRFWGLILDLPRTQVDEWIAAQRSNPWQRRTR